MNANAKRPLIVWGAGGHAGVVLDAALAAGKFEIVGLIDDFHSSSDAANRFGFPILGGREFLAQRDRIPHEQLIVAIGDNRARAEIAQVAQSLGYDLATVIHPSAVISPSAHIGAGSFISAGAIVNSQAVIASSVIVNSGAIVEHDCVVQNSAHVAPGARLAGAVHVGARAWVGIGATVRERITISEDSVVGAGAVVVRDVPAKLTVVGVPAKALNTKPVAIPMPRENSATKAFAAPLHVGRPNIGDRQQLFQRLNEMLDRRWLTNDGPLVKEFERRIAQFVGVKHCLAVNNATIGLEIAARALGLSGEVIVPAFTFVATAHALQWQQITPVFVDVDPKTHNLDPRAVERAITPRTTGIVGVHVWGNPCAVQELSAIAQRHKLKLLFDAAHAFGCASNGTMLGNFGDVEVFSFHATKFLNSGEGGAIVTNSDTLAQQLRLMRSFGSSSYDQVVDVGTNGKMSEFCAAMGLTSLDSITQFIETNRQNYADYRVALHDIPGLKLFEHATQDRHNCQYVVTEVDPAIACLSRDEIVACLQAENVLARRYFYPGCHRMEPYRGQALSHSQPLPVTELLCERVFQLPTGTAVSSADIGKIGDILRQAVAQARRRRERSAA